jgi:hypothetical protein
MKNKETFEEAAERVAKLKYGATIYGLERVNAFKEGAKYQAERMYSEEDMKDYALKCVSTYLFNGDFISDNLRISIVENNNKQFEQFKKK